MSAVHSITKTEIKAKPLPNYFLLAQLSLQKALS
jgi:hypothetical protein